MATNTQSNFQPPPPIRTSTAGSQKSMSSGTMSPDMLSPTERSPTSPAEESFFGAITSRMRRGRSRSRSRAAASRKRSKSPIVMPPEHFPATSTAASMRPQQSRHVSTASQSSMMSTPAKSTRPSLQSPSRRSTSGSDMWRGRHSNSWLFNDFSVTDTAKDLFHLGRKP